MPSNIAMYCRTDRAADSHSQPELLVRKTARTDCIAAHIVMLSYQPHGAAVLTNTIRTLCALMTMTGATAFAATPAKSSGDEIVDLQGRALYIFAKDLPNYSRCNDICARNWPPYYAPDDRLANHDFKRIRREDGSYQWAFRGHPVYYFSKDTAIGDRKGNSAGGAWSSAPVNLMRIPPAN